jgi:hypothetical protein
VFEGGKSSDGYIGSRILDLGLEFRV